MKQFATGLLVAGLLLIGGAPFATADTYILQKHPDGSSTRLGLVTITTVMSGATSNATAASVGVSPGPKSFYGQVSGTGAVTQTQAIYGDVDDDEANGVLLCTLTLSGTTKAADACPVVTANFAFYYVITTNTTGTGATGVVYAMY